jgi:hypothetical protein
MRAAILTGEADLQRAMDFQDSAAFCEVNEPIFAQESMMRTVRYACFIAVAIVAMSSLAAGQQQHDRGREKIGEVLGQPVYRDQIRTGKDVNLDSEVSRLFIHPVLEKYRKEHQAEFTPTKEELEHARAYFDNWHREQLKGREFGIREKLKKARERLAGHGLTQEARAKLEIEATSAELDLKPPGLDYAHFVMDHWKFERHLYDHFGGGRILWQQAGFEAFDAMRTWLETQEQEGAFRFRDGKLRAEVYGYYDWSHGPYLIDDPARIRKDFLEPGWALQPKQAK